MGLSTEYIHVWEIAGIVISLFFSGFFSSAETALTSLSNIKLEQLIDKFPVWGKGLRSWRNNPNGVLTTILIGNTLANITASALATDLAGDIFPGRGIPYAIGGMTFLLLITGEITPKTLARNYAESIAPSQMNVVLVFHLIFFPFSWVITLMIRGLFWATGSKYRQGEPVTDEDVEYIVRLGRRQGTLDKDKESLLSSIFEFSDTITKEIMVPRTDMVSIPLESNYQKVVDVSLRTGFSRIPVFEETVDKIVGIFHTKNLIAAIEMKEDESFIANRMRPVVFIPESKKISEVLRLFQKDRIHMAIVVDEFGGTEGLVTMEDIIEELLGEIQDEFDMEEDRLVEIGGGIYLADARINIGELEEKLNISFPDNRGYESLGGFLMEEAHDVPAVGWSHSSRGFSYQVTQADPQRVIKVRIEKISSDDSSQGSGNSSRNENATGKAS